MIDANTTDSLTLGGRICLLRLASAVPEALHVKNKSSHDDPAGDPATDTKLMQYRLRLSAVRSVKKKGERMMMACTWDPFLQRPFVFTYADCVPSGCHRPTRIRHRAKHGHIPSSLLHRESCSVGKTKHNQDKGVRERVRGRRLDPLPGKKQFKDEKLTLAIL
eukprot:scaffold4425_cov168-Amphora_coffeaeformis.AAC.14